MLLFCFCKALSLLPSAQYARAARVVPSVACSGPLRLLVVRSCEDSGRVVHFHRQVALGASSGGEQRAVAGGQHSRSAARRAAHGVRVDVDVIVVLFLCALCTPGPGCTVQCNGATFNAAVVNRQRAPRVGPYVARGAQAVQARR
jgi:hypothetical protein